jgi:lipoprotein Spr
VKLEGKENKQLIEETYWWIGTPYKYGGDSKRGIDCSGLVKNIFKTVYKTELKRNADDIMRETEITDRKSLRDGDLVFFRINEEKKATHVGIFLNDNKFLHSTIQKGVIISDMEEPYYLKNYFRGGRIKSINN